MKRSLLPFILLISLSIQGQTVLFSEDLESTPTAFDLNTSDVNSISNGSNQWIINDDYLGGSDDLFCILTFPYTINNTASQPVGISNQNGNYLHTISNEALADGILCCSFQAADGLCTNAENYFSRMNTDVSTVGYTDVTLDFWWLCNGGASIFGEVYYSIDGGASWNLITVPFSQYHNQSNWGAQSISIPAFDGQSTLRFGFRFVNGVSLSAADPGFAVDDIRISGTTTTLNEITTDNVSDLTVCPGDIIDVDYTATGNFNGPNIFSAELSDGSGSFANPVVIGSIASVSSGTISSTIPANAVPGPGYRIRTVASDPITIGTDNMVDITIESAPNAGLDSSIVLCKASGFYDLFIFLQGNPDPGGSWTDPGGSAHSGAFSTITDPAGAYTYTVTGTGNCTLASSMVTVQLVDPPNAGNAGIGDVCENGGQVQLINLLVSSPDLNGTWTDPNGLIVAGIFDPLLDPVGTYIYVVPGTGPCENDSTFLPINVIPAPNAGIGGTLTICNTSPALDLFLELSGSPDVGGVWTDPQNMMFNGIIDPSSASSGLYTYTVSGGTCPDANAALAVVIDDCTSIQELMNEDIQIGPNPSTDQLIIRMGGLYNFSSWAIHDMGGKVVMSGSIDDKTETFSLNIDLTNGAYMLQMEAMEGVVVKQFMVMDQ